MAQQILPATVQLFEEGFLWFGSSQSVPHADPCSVLQWSSLGLNHSFLYQLEGGFFEDLLVS